MKKNTISREILSDFLIHLEAPVCYFKLQRALPTNSRPSCKLLIKAPQGSFCLLEANSNKPLGASETS